MNGRPDAAAIHENFKRKLEAAFANDGDGIYREYRIRGRGGNDTYITKLMSSGCTWIGERPPNSTGYDVIVGAKFLKKTIDITPDGSFITMVRTGSDETWILLKGKDSACAVARDTVKDPFLKAIIRASTDPICLGHELGFTLDFKDPNKIRPFASVILCLDTTKEDREDSPSEQYFEFPCHQGFGAPFNEQKAINYLENKMKQDPAINHEETIQTAVTAFKYMLGEDFKGNEIKVYVIAKELGIDRALSVEEIEENLVAINDLVCPPFLVSTSAQLEV